MTIARRDYHCNLCGKLIPKGTEYHRVDVTPWNCRGDADPGFYTMHEHNLCHRIWAAVAADYDYYPDVSDWLEVVEDWASRQTPPEGGFLPEDTVVVWRNFEKWFPGTRGRFGTVAEVKPDEGDSVHVMVRFPDEDKPYAHSPDELALVERKAA